MIWAFFSFFYQSLYCLTTSSGPSLVAVSKHPKVISKFFLHWLILFWNVAAEMFFLVQKKIYANLLEMPGVTQKYAAQALWIIQYRYVCKVKYKHELKWYKHREQYRKYEKIIVMFIW